MEKAMYPSKVMRITQKDHEGTHADCWAIDEACIDGGISDIYAPFTGIIKKIYTKDANQVWLQSSNPVLYADGTQDYMTAMFCHNNDVSNLWVGKKINQGEAFYKEGTKGYATGNHCHMEFAKGVFDGSGWHKDNAGYWSINNGKKITECVFIDDSYQILNSKGYSFKNVKELEPKKIGTPVERNEYINQIRINADNVRARTSPNGDIIGYINTGIYNSLEIVNKDGYDWHKVEENLYCAIGDWAEWLPKKEKSVETPEKDNTAKITELQNEVDKLKEQLIKTQEQLEKYKDELKKISDIELIFENSKTGYYAIELIENEKLYIGKVI